MKPVLRRSRSLQPAHGTKLRYEHWLVDNQVYFITARCRDRFPAFATDAAKAAFWDRFEHYATQFGFTPWITTLLDNHYHTLCYLSV
jgi:REP element-mobilizing transposase RayT